MSEPLLFFTGFPGFLGSALLPRLLAERAGANAVCLVQPRYLVRARAATDRIGAQRPDLAGRIELVEGDITRAGLGLDGSWCRWDRVTEVFHLAAVYDLSVGRDVALRVNLEGTRHVLDLARGCASLEHLHYVSTCYVSGRSPGEFREDELEKGQRFHNAYEETKFLAEVEVRRAMTAGLPATIYRPSIVVGDSRTGETQKYDGPYYAIRWLLRQPTIAVMPLVGDPRTTELNVVPRDFVVEAMAHLSRRGGSVGRVYHLADPRPLTMAALLALLGAATGRRILRLRLPLGLAKSALTHVPGLYRLTGIPAAALDYLVHPTRYATTNLRRDLEGTGIEVPRVAEYVDRLVRFVRENPDVGSAPMA